MGYLPPKGGGITLVVFCFIFAPLCCVATVLRLWARRLKRKKLEFNDYAILLGTVLAVANAVLTILAVLLGGVGRRQMTVMPQFPTLQKITLALAIVWTLANTAVKFSILHLYLVIFKRNSFRYAVYFVMFLTAGYCITNIVQNLLTCRPVAYFWDKTIPGGYCSSSQAPFLASACINMTLDVIIVVLPMPVLWNLHLQTQKKVALSIIFGLGSLICIVSAVRIDSIYHLDYMDFSYSVVADGIYSVLEPCLGVINASLPVLQPIASKISRTKIFSLLRSSANSSNRKDEKPANGLSIGSEPIRKKRFHRLDESSTLNDDVHTLTDVDGPGNRSAVYNGMLEMHDGANKQQNGEIKVTTAWQVRSQENGSMV